MVTSVVFLNKTENGRRKERERGRAAERDGKEERVFFFINRSCFFKIYWPCLIGNFEIHKADRLAIWLKIDIAASRLEFVGHKKGLAMRAQFFLLHETSYFALKVPS